MQERSLAMNKKNAASSAVTASAAALIFTLTVFFSSCSDSANNKPENISESCSVTGTETASPYLLVRGWEGRELLDSLFFCGKNRTLPCTLEDESDLILSDGMLILPDGSYAEASVSAENNGDIENTRTVITALRFKRESAPADFSLYGVDFSAKPEDIPDIIGIANSVYGEGETTLTHSFFEGGITELTFVFNEKTLSEIYIAA